MANANAAKRHETLTEDRRYHPELAEALKEAAAAPVGKTYTAEEFSDYLAKLTENALAAAKAK